MSEDNDVQKSEPDTGRRRNRSKTWLLVVVAVISGFLALLFLAVLSGPDGFTATMSAAPPNQTSGELDRIVNALRWGNIVFTVPPTLAYGSTARAELVMSRIVSYAELQEELHTRWNAQSVHTDRVRLADRMRAELIASTGLSVRNLSPAEQGVANGEVPRWTWEVSAKDDFDGGPQYLDLSLYAQLQIENTNTPISLRTYNRTIEVKITTYQRTVRFVAGNWQWLWTAILVPVGTYMWNRKRRRKSKSSSAAHKPALPALRSDDAETG
jgi:hypothetical protein